MTRRNDLDTDQPVEAGSLSDGRDRDRCSDPASKDPASRGRRAGVRGASGGWTLGQRVLGAALILGVALPLGALLARELLATLSIVTPATPAASANPGEGSGARAAPNRPDPLDAFNTKNLRVESDRIRSGGPPKDGIPSLTDPAFVPAAEADFLQDRHRVVSVTIDGKTRAYPLNILNWHEAIHDTLGGTPILVVYCPLCDSVSVVDRRLDGRTYEFGISGLLMNSNVLLYDRTDEALWSQVRLTAISGPNAGRSLRHLDGWSMMTFGQWKREHPNARIVSAKTGYRRNYRENPYGGYFANDRLMFPASPSDERFSNKTRVVGVKLGDVARAYPLKRIREAADGRVTDTIGGGRLVLEAGRAPGMVRVVEAPEQAAVVHTFWFAWYAFHPQTQVYEAASKNGEPSARLDRRGAVRGLAADWPASARASPRAGADGSWSTHRAAPACCDRRFADASRRSAGSTGRTTRASAASVVDPRRRPHGVDRDRAPPHPHPAGRPLRRSS